MHRQQPRAGGAQPRVLDPGGGRGAGLGSLHRRRHPPQHGRRPRHRHRGLHRHVRGHHRDRQQVPGEAHCNVVMLCVTWHAHCAVYVRGVADGQLALPAVAAAADPGADWAQQPQEQREEGGAQGLGQEALPARQEDRHHAGAGRHAGPCQISGFQRIKGGIKNPFSLIVNDLLNKVGGSRGSGQPSLHQCLVH